MANVRTADCCGSSMNHSYLCIDDAWHLCVFLPTGKIGTETKWHSISMSAKVCHACGAVLRDLTFEDTRRYFPDVFEPADDLIAAIVAKTQEEIANDLGAMADILDPPNEKEIERFKPLSEHATKNHGLDVKGAIVVRDKLTVEVVKGGK